MPVRSSTKNTLIWASDIELETIDQADLCEITHRLTSVFNFKGVK